MPINYKLYPKNWKSEIRPKILSRANHRCENCGVDNYEVGCRNLEGKFYKLSHIESDLENYGIDLFDKELKHCLDKYGAVKLIKIVLTVAHLDHDTTNNEDSNLKALCQRCHLHHDKELHQSNAKETRKKKKGIIELF